MYINKLHLANVRNTDDLYIDNFSRINVFTGNNGQGKSTIVDSIVFCLTDFLQYRMEELIQHGKKQTTIFIEFILKEHLYEYRIEINRKGNTNRTLIIDRNDKEPFTQSDAVKKIQEIIDPILTLYSSISIQHTSTELLFDTPANRLQKIKNILKLDNLKEAVNLMGEDIKENKEKIKILESEINILSSLKFELEELPEIKILNEEQCNKEIQELEEQRKNYDIQYKQYIDSYNKLKIYDEAQQKIIELNKEKEELVRRIQKVPEFQNNLEELNTRQFETKKEINAIQSEINLIEKGNGSLKEIEKKLEEYIPKRIRSINITEEEINNLVKNIADLKSYFSSLDEKIKLAETGKCWTCGSEIHTDPEKLQQEKTILSTDIQNKEKELTESRTSYKNYEKLIQENNIILEKRKVYEEQLSSLQKELSNYNPIEDLKKEIQHYSKELNEIEIKISEQSSIREEYNKVTNSNKEIENKISIIDSKIEENKKVEKPSEIFEEPKKPNVELLDKLKLALINYINQKKEYERIENQNEKTKKDQEENKEKIKDKKEKIFSLSSENRIIKETQKVIDKDFSIYLINKVSIIIKNKMNEFFSRAYYGKYEIEFEQYSSGIEFYYKSNDDENLHPVSTLSGYERLLFANSFRLALSRLQDLGILILDEIDESASPENSLKLYELLLQEKMEQIFCVTHHESTVEYIKNQFDSKVFEIEDGKIIN